MEKKNKSVFDKIKDNPIRSVKQLFSVILLVIVTVMVFFTSVGTPLLMIIYIAVLIALLVINFWNLAATWWIYLIAAFAGCLIIKVVSMLTFNLFAALQNNLMVAAFGYADNENEGGAVPAACAKPFDPVEKALNELEMKFNSNAITEEEYEKKKREILNKEI